MLPELFTDGAILSAARRHLTAIRWRLRSQVEYSQMKVTLHIARRWQYYIYKVAIPQMLCTLFCFSSLFYPIEAEDPSTTVPGTFGARLDSEVK